MTYRQVCTYHDCNRNWAVQVDSLLFGRLSKTW